MRQHSRPLVALRNALMIGSRLIRWVVSTAVLTAIPSLSAERQAEAATTGEPAGPWNREVAAQAAALFQQLPAAVFHYEDLPEADAVRLLRAGAAYQKLVREKLDAKWFAALVAADDSESYAIRARFQTWRELLEFLAEENALVEVWACTEAGAARLRRITPGELAQLKHQAHEPPTVTTVTWREAGAGRAVTCNLEFGFHAAETVRAANEAYQRHRRYQLSAQRALGARNDRGLPDAVAQWEALQAEIQTGSLPVATLPPKPAGSRDLFVAVEFEVDEQSNFVKVNGFYRDSEVGKQVIAETQVLFLQRAGAKARREVMGFRSPVGGGPLEPVTNPLLGRDVVELRVKDPAQGNPKRWPVLEFGEPEVLKQSALAHFSQLNAYLQRRQLSQLMKQANLALIAEPIIAALNIGGGLAGWGFPAGEAARLPYNLITWKLIASVPSAKQMRELFAVMAARDRNPQAKVKPERYLSRQDIRVLQEAGRKLTDQEVETYLETMSEEDIRAMLRLSREGMFDAKITTFLNELTSSFKVSGVSDQAGPIRDIFNNVRFGVNGDINLSTLLLIALDRRGMTPLSGVSLKELSRGQGPTEAWFQYLLVSVDVRAVLNTLVRLTKSTYAKKELEKPFPYAPRLDELAAYEVRIFGFPLLMFYKRGLIKAFSDAYEKDYAFGLRGVTLVEHFRTREEMEAEIQARRMFPLGLVRVPSAKGRWKETDLAVYAHRIPTGKHRGKTSLIVYGLKAYAEYSEVIARDLLRFQQYERGLREGAVIEQVIAESGPAASPATAFEPIIHAGPDALQSFYDPLFGALLEVRRDRLRQSWGLPADESELNRAQQELASRGVRIGQGDPLAKVDAYNSSFIYRRQVEGREQQVRVTHIPSLAEVDLEMQKSEEAKVIEELRREAAAGGNDGVVLLNEVREVGGRLELGPLLRDAQGQVVGAGVAGGAKAVAEIFDIINRLPVPDRARLQANHFAATVVELDREGRGKQKVFLTVEFPLGEARRDWTNSLTGEREIVFYENGLWRKSVTARRIVELRYDERNVEARSQTYFNRGSLEAPVRGPLLEETRTLECWQRDLTQPGLDPYRPIIAKLRVNYVTGEFRRETYGLFALPIEIVDEQCVTRNRYTPYGILASATVFDNGRQENDAARPGPDRLLRAEAGRPRAELVSRLPANSELTGLSAGGYRIVIGRKDLVKGLVSTQTWDNANFGRKMTEDIEDRFDGTQSFVSRLTWEYDADHHFGLVPTRATTRSLASGTLLAEVTTLSFDPGRRRLVGREVSYTGQTRTNTWDYRWSNPVEAETPQRRITLEYNRDETETRTRTVIKSTGETLDQGTGRYDAATRTWNVIRQVWYRPDIPDHTETNLYSAFGKLISVRVGESLETRPSYSPDGTLQASRTFRPDPATGRYDVLCRQEDDYHWNSGRREAQVRLFVDGTVADEYRTVADAEGRIVEEGLRRWPQLELRTTRIYDGESERVLKVEVLQNGQIRSTHHVLGVAPRPGGGWWQKVAVTPAWGLALTNSFLIGDPLGRLVESELENGDRARVVGWAAGSAIAQTTEVWDRHGHLKERWAREALGGVAEGLPYDLVKRYKISPWGDAGLVEKKAMVRGTDVPLFSDKGGERLYFDRSKNYESPHYAVDTTGRFGLDASLAGASRTNVTAVWVSRLVQRASSSETNRPSERVMELTGLDLHGLLYHPFTRRISDGAGNLLEEAAGKAPDLGARGYSEAIIVRELELARVTRKTVYGYQRAWVAAQADPAAGQALVVSSGPPKAGAAAWSVNAMGWRELPTEASSYQLDASRSTTKGEGGFRLVRRLSAPRFLKENRYFPGVTNVWLAWSTTDFNGAGVALFDSELILDAQGELSTLVTRKPNSQGQPGDKIVYRLPRPSPGDWRAVAASPGSQPARLSLGGPDDLSRCDFVAFYAQVPAPARIALRLQDVAHRSVRVVDSSGAGGPDAAQFWPVEQVCWLPNENLPRHGAAVSAPPDLVAEGAVFVAPIAELVGAGLEVARLASCELEVVNAGTQPVRATPLFKLANGQRFRTSPEGLDFTFEKRTYSSGLTMLRRQRADLTAAQKRKGIGWNAVLGYGGGRVAVLNPRAEPPYYPILTVTDDSDPDCLRPLYALTADDGAFLEYYQTEGVGDVQVYTVANGFGTPKMEVFRGAVLDDEITPGVLAFGHGYYVTLPLAKAGGGLSSVLARLHNRCVASAFALGGENLLRAVFNYDRTPTELRQVTREYGPAASQARAISQLPTLAAALVPRRQLPWGQTHPLPPLPGALEVQTNWLRTHLSQLSGLYTNSGLIPTSPGTRVAQFVDTPQEAAVIELAVKLRETALANDLLAFYWEKSQGGASLLHDCYDAETRASLTREPGNARASDAPITARAQLAIAQAAFCLGTATGDSRALEFGRRLVEKLLAEFHPQPDETPWPGGIAESVVQPLRRQHRLTLWPEAKRFSVGSNARAYLLFTRLAERAGSYPFGSEWGEKMLEAAREEAAWLTNRIGVYAQTAGVVPRGLFELQDVHDKSRALATELWTATDDWLSFIEAADRLGMSKELTRGWLDNLARAHGVAVQGNWGLDWVIPLQRPEAISVVLTAKFLRVARLLEYDAAADFAQWNLGRLRQGDIWPVVVTVASTNSPLATGLGREIYPAQTVLPNKRKAGRSSARLPPPAMAPAGQNQQPAASGWPETLGVYAELASPAWPTRLPAGSPREMRPEVERDVTQFLGTAAGFYLGLAGVAFFWWGLAWMRRRRRSLAPASASGLLVSEEVMRRAEERWAKRVLGMSIPARAEHSRYANGAIEQNFLMQLRATYKLVLEWRRVVNGWSENDERLVEGGDDEWLNGLDEFAVLAGIYMRWVVKAGRKDGLPQSDVLLENEDSNHIWSRLVMYFSESHLRLLALMKDFKANPDTAAVLGVNDQIELVLRMMGARARNAAFDARTGFDAPAGVSALDLLILQLPGASLRRLAEEMERKWDVPLDHVVSFIRGYKSFKEREQLYPIHPYLLEAAKMLPHFLLMGLVALIWYNNGLGGLKIYPYLKQLAFDLALDWHSLSWAAPLFAGVGLSVAARLLEVYRYRWSAQPAHGATLTLDKDVANLFGRATQISTPALRLGWWWNPLLYQRAGWIFRSAGLGLLALALFRLDPPDFASFMFVKGWIGVLLLVESAGLFVPLLVSRFSSWLEDRVSANPRAGRLSRFANQLNLVPTRPASLIWLSIKYHFQPSVPTGGFWPMTQAIGFYLISVATFFFVGSYMFKQALEIWFQETYRHGWDFRMAAGAFVFWNTMYLLRFGLFVALTALVSAAAVYPVKVVCAAGAFGCFVLQFLSQPFSRYLDHHFGAAGVVLVVSLALMAFEHEIVEWVRRSRLWRGLGARRQAKEQAALDQIRRDPNRVLGVVYMSGDDLSFHKLTPELLITRLQILRDRLGSGGMRLLAQAQPLPDDAELTQWFKALYELERRADVTLWHPLQVVVAGEEPRLPEKLGLNLSVASASERDRLLAAWHIRRWLVTMMSTAGHAQDTAINLVDIALCLAREGLGPNTAFYLIQNKYDNNDNNRPAQLPYDKGELGQRNKLARLLMLAAPGCRAYSLNDWTPFGFKAGGLVGMDLVFEESLKLTNMLLLDRNANAHDLDAVMADLKLALSDPGVVIVIPGRSTTNTLTPIGQSSQLVEEGQRALTRGVMLVGGLGAETLGTGWGNIQAIYYGRVQRALCDTTTPKMPLTAAAARGATFGDRYEGLIGFGPHAIGISEDIWGVTQAAHNALALGYQVKFRRSQAMWHKLRECWSHAEWLSAFPRWSGGYLQMMLDPIMQRINDGGPLSVFAKEIRASGGRFFLSAPSALLSILLMPLAIICDVSPFVQILVLLWNLGLFVNQVLTTLGLVACLEGTGFNRLAAVAGAGVAAVLGQEVPAFNPFSLPLVVAGFLAGGFCLGLGRWLYYRGRDIMLFGPQLVIHALGQVVRQSLEFVLSGASANDAKAVNIAFRTWVGPREDRPFETYQNFVNLRTVVWVVGLGSLLLDLFALANLDFLNVLLLLPSLMFSVSALVGPFLMQPKTGKHLGAMVWAPKLLGWLASFGFYLLVAWLIAGGGWWEWAGMGLLAACLGRILMEGLRYMGYSRSLRKLRSQLATELAAQGLPPQEAEKLASSIVAGLGMDLEKTRTALERTALSGEAQAAIAKTVQDRVFPLLKKPITDLQEPPSANRRFACECRRSFVLGLFTFVWFFVVPMPGLLVFTAPGGYRISTLLSSVLAGAALLLAGVLTAGLLSLALEWWEKHGWLGAGLVAAIANHYRALESLAAQPGKLSPVDTARLYAMFTDVQTYVDQRSYHYAWRSLRQIQQILAAAGPGPAPGSLTHATQPPPSTPPV
jgi:hypothetical protein